MDSSIVVTKLFIPPPPSRGVQRPRLIDSCDQALARRSPLTLVSAPAGYGKSSLVCQWVSSLDRQVAWVSLESRDDEPPRFWRYVLAALERTGSILLQDEYRMRSDSEATDWQELVGTLINELADKAVPMILVLDDYHLITSRTIHEGVDYLLSHMPPNLHLVLCTRIDPPLSLSRLRMHGLLNEIRMDELCFSPPETKRFFEQRMKGCLTEGQLETLEAKTEGWVAGLQLAAISMAEKVDPQDFITGFSGSQHYILEYLIDEVLESQSDQIKSFLMKTSILTRLCAPLCDAVTGERTAETLLKELYERNLFLIPLDSEHRWYRYHQLFDEFLFGTLRRLDPEGIGDLHRKAATWYSAEGLADEAVYHALSIPDYQLAGRIVMEHWRATYHKGRIATAIRWIEALPKEVLVESPPLVVALCWTLFIRGEYSRIAGYLESIDGALAQDESDNTHPEYRIIMHQSQLLHALLLREEGHIRAATDLVERLLPSIEELRDSLGEDYYHMGCTAYYSQLGYCFASAGEYRRAEEALQQACTHAHACGNYMALAHATMALIRLLLSMRKTDRALAVCQSELANLAGYSPSEYPAIGLIQLAHAEVLLARGKGDLALQELLSGLEVAAASGQVRFLAQGYLTAARLYASIRDNRTCMTYLHKAAVIISSIDDRMLTRELTELQDSLARSGSSQVDPLSPRELQVLRAICEGKSNQEIADSLFLSLNTVKRHINTIYGKLAVKRRSQAILEARYRKLFTEVH